eukprot:TRINITY_DN6749_c0_g1_i2.p1 TRINITY_DN6749_c0_g1~~TRINITY_DN6749_c0_g1_i2.p1  ORF type:complete len:316 (-),score=67.77 TRINITY_DN6749_c0_g1_i2:83-1009(-)
MEGLDPSLLSSKMQEVVNVFQSLVNDVNEKIKSISEQQQRYEETKKKIEESILKVETKIDLNVGGTKFSASKATLLSMEGTYFYAMLASDRWKPDNQGEYFIDRSPKHFALIIDYLRSEKLDLSQLTEIEKEELEEELDYYQIPISSNDTRLSSSQWCWDDQIKIPIIRLFDNNRSAETTSQGSCAVIGDKPVTTFQVKVDTHGSSWAMVGMAPKTQQMNSHFYHKCGWHLYFNGALYSQDGDSNRPYATKIPDNAVVGVNYDREKGTISFSVDGQDKGIAFKGIPNDITLYPCVQLHSKNSTAEIIC